MTSRRTALAASFVVLSLSAPHAFAQETPPPAATPEAAPAPATTPEDASAKTDTSDASATAEAELPGKPSSYARLTDENLNLEGGIGFHSIAAARVGKKYSFRTAFLGEIFSGSDIIRSGDSNTRLGGNVLIQGTVLDWLSVNLGLKASSNMNSYGQPQAMLTQGDLNLGATAVYEVSDYLSIGGDLALFFPANFGAAGLDGSGTSIRPRLLASLDTRPLTEGKVPIDVHLNFGMLFDGSEGAVPDSAGEVTRIERFAYNISAYNYLELGLGAEYDLKYVRPFLGFNMALPVGGRDGICNNNGTEFKCAAEAGFGAFPKTMSLGVRAEPVEHLGLHAGVDLGLTTSDAIGVPVTLPYNVVLGVSWTIDPTPKIKIVEKTVEKEKIVDRTPVLGFVVGKVLDEETKEPVAGATVEYLGSSFTPQSTNPNNGTFRSYGMPPESKVMVRITHPDYEPLEMEQTIVEGESTMDITLKAIPKKADIVGRVLDAKDKPIMLAKIRVIGEKGFDKSVPVDAAGNFRLEVTPGKFSVTARSPDHLTRARSITLKKDDKITLDFSLSSKPKKNLAVLKEDRIDIKKKVFFDKNKATIQKKSFLLLDSVASVLADNPEKAKKVRIEGHTDDSGKASYNLDLSQRRAEAVRKYLIAAGVDPSRLESKGYGSERPILPNLNRRNRAINRRVEFKITLPVPK